MALDALPQRVGSWIPSYIDVYGAAPSMTDRYTIDAANGWHVLGCTGHFNDLWRLKRYTRDCWQRSAPGRTGTGAGSPVRLYLPVNRRVIHILRIPYLPLPNSIHPSHKDGKRIDRGSKLMSSL